MLRDLKNYSIIYIVSLIALLVIAGIYKTLSEDASGGGLALFAQIISPAMAGQLHFKRTGTTAGIGYSFKFSFLAALLCLILSALLVLMFFVGGSLYFTRSPVDGLGFLWVMSNMDRIERESWIISTAILIPLITIGNFMFFKFGIMVMRWVVNMKTRRSEKLLAENGN